MASEAVRHIAESGDLMELERELKAQVNSELLLLY